MDNARDGRRVRVNRFPPVKRQIFEQSGLDGGDENVVPRQTCKKERLGELGVAGKVSLNRENCEMDRTESDGEDELCPNTGFCKRFKFPKKFLDDCNTANRASVPRKLRSAMRKRSLESISPALSDPKRLNYAISEVLLPKKDVWKKYKIDKQKDSKGAAPKKAIVVPITKDEEEVAETLYALAGMFSDANVATVSKLTGKLAEANCPALRETEDSVPAFEDTAEDRSLITKGLDREIIKLQSWSEASQLDLPNSMQLPVVLDNNSVQVNLQKTPPFPRPKSITEMMSCNSVLPASSAELNHWIISKELKYEETPATAKENEIALGLDVAVGSQPERPHPIKEGKMEAMRPRCCLTASHVKPPAPSLLSSSKLPAWLANNVNCATKPYLSEDLLTTAKDSEVLVARRKSSWKRCSTHVYICRLIQVLQTSERKCSSSSKFIELKANIGSSQGVLVAPKKLYGRRNCSTEVVAFSSTVRCSSFDKNPNEVRNADLSHQRFLQDQQQASKSGHQTPELQTFDFLSLSTGDCGLEANWGSNRGLNGLEAPAQLHVPYLQSLGQNRTINPFYLLQSHYSSTSFADNYSEAAQQQVQMQMLPYLSITSHQSGAVAHPKQQQRIWTCQPPPQYKAAGLTAPIFSDWKGRAQDPPSPTQNARAFLPPSSSSVDVLSANSKYGSISSHSQQQQQLITITSSLPQARLKGQHHQFTSGYEGGCCPVYTPPLQLLCNDYL